MLFKILKLFGLDLPAKVAEAKSVIEQRVEEVADYAKQLTQTAAVIAALSAVAAILAAMAVGVGLFALYRVIAESYGVTAQNAQVLQRPPATSEHQDKRRDVRRWIIPRGTASTGQFMVDEASDAHRSQILVKQDQSRVRRQRFVARRQLERQNRL
jgi:hypothetical protein